MHRYIFHHIFLQNGFKAVVGIVCQPHTCSTFGNYTVLGFYIINLIVSLFSDLNVDLSVGLARVVSVH